MGFGILFIGYFISAVFSMLGNYSFIGLLIGYFIMFCALLELKKYCPTFLYAVILAVIMLVCSFYETFIGVDYLLTLGMGQRLSSVSHVLEIAEYAIEFAFNLSLLYGIADLARRVDFCEIRRKAFRNMAFVGIYSAYQLFMLLPISALDDEKGFLMSILLIFMLVCSIFNLTLIFRCYAFICPEGDEEMERKPSRFAFINRIRARNDAKEQETIDYYNKKIQDKKSKKHHKKKR